MTSSPGSVALGAVGRCLSPGVWVMAVSSIAVLGNVCVVVAILEFCDVSW